MKPGKWCPDVIRFGEDLLEYNVDKQLPVDLYHLASRAIYGPSPIGSIRIHVAFKLREMFDETR